MKNKTRIRKHNMKNTSTKIKIMRKQEMENSNKQIKIK